MRSDTTSVISRRSLTDLEVGWVRADWIERENSCLRLANAFLEPDVIYLVRAAAAAAAARLSSCEARVKMKAMLSATQQLEKEIKART